jgi:hypothetical protein
VTRDNGSGLLRVIGSNIAVRRRATDYAGWSEQIGRPVQWVSAVTDSHRLAAIRTVRAGR